MIDIRILNKLVNNWVRDLIDNGELNVTEDGYIYYTQTWINEKLFQEWLLEEGYSTKELMIILECFENFKEEIDFFIDDIIDEKYNEYTQEVYITYDEIYYTIQAVTKKIERQNRSIETMNLYNEIIYRLYEIGQTLEDIEFISIYNRYEFKELELNKDEFLNFLAKEDIGTVDNLTIKIKEKNIWFRLRTIPTGHYFELMQVPSRPKEEEKDFYSVI